MQVGTEFVDSLCSEAGALWAAILLPTRSIVLPCNCGRSLGECLVEMPCTYVSVCMCGLLPH